MSAIPNIKMPPYELMPVNTYLRQEQFMFQHTCCPQIVATLTEDGRIKELEPIIGADNFEIPENIKERAIREFAQGLSFNGFDVKDIDQGYLDITKGLFNMRLYTKDQVPFSDVTLHQINMVYKNFVADRNDTCQRTMNMAIRNLENAEKFTQEDAALLSHALENATNKSIKTYLVYNPDNNLSRSASHDA